MNHARWHIGSRLKSNNLLKVRSADPSDMSRLRHNVQGLSDLHELVTHHDTCGLVGHQSRAGAQSSYLNEVERSRSQKATSGERLMLAEAIDCAAK